MRNDLRSLLSAHGATPNQTDRCCNTLHRHAVLSAHSIICCRRELERNMTPNRQERPGEPPP